MNQPLNNLNQPSTIYNRAGESRTLDENSAKVLVRDYPSEWSFTPPPPPGWERETPRYRVRHDIDIESLARHRQESPHSQANIGVWQYGERPLKAGETIATREWPHPTFLPLNYSAQKVLDFFNTQPKSTMPRSPWRLDRLQLGGGEGGVSGRLEFDPLGRDPTNPHVDPPPPRAERAARARGPARKQ